MILDNLLMFDSPLAPRNLAQIVATYDSTNIIDLGVISGIPTSANGGGARDIGIGDDPAMKLLVQVSTAFVSAGGGTLAINLAGAVDNGAGAPAAFSTWWTSPIYTIAQMVAGARLLDMDFPRPPQGVAIPRYVKLQYAIATATITAGAVIAGIVLDRDDQFYSSTNNAVMGGYVAGINVAN
jgi:hypothetical protein